MTSRSKTHRRRLARTQRLFDFDRGLQSPLVAGADEAGRGCLAGPLVAAAVLIDYERLSRSDRRALSGLHDSKQMTPERREDLFPAVLGAAARTSIVVRCVRGIDGREASRFIGVGGREPRQQHQRNGVREDEHGLGHRRADRVYADRRQRDEVAHDVLVEPVVRELQHVPDLALDAPSSEPADDPDARPHEPRLVRRDPRRRRQARLRLSLHPRHHRRTGLLVTLAHDQPPITGDTFTATTTP